jgi:hypothetical protein
MGTGVPLAVFLQPLCREQSLIELRVQDVLHLRFLVQPLTDVRAETDAFGPDGFEERVATGAARVLLSIGHAVDGKGAALRAFVQLLGNDSWKKLKWTPKTGPAAKRDKREGGRRAGERFDGLGLSLVALVSLRPLSPRGRLPKVFACRVTGELAPGRRT